MSAKPKIIVIVGPTSVGKTSLSIALARAIGGEVVSADSRQVYRGLDLGTGKVTRAEMEGVPHYLIDVTDPLEQFTAADFMRLGRSAIANIVSSGHVPIVVGGTGLYVDALVGRVALDQGVPDPNVRAHVSTLSLFELQEELQRLDPARYATIDIKNPRRLMRAIEIASAAQAPLPQATEPAPYDVQWIGLTLPREELQTRIVNRLYERLGAGMLDEARRLYANGLSLERMDALGLEYRYLARHIAGLLTYSEMLARLEIEIFKYAKRQMTWFKRNPDIKWFAPKSKKEISESVQKFLQS